MKVLHFMLILLSNNGLFSQTDAVIGVSPISEQSTNSLIYVFHKIFIVIQVITILSVATESDSSSLLSQSLLDPNLGHFIKFTSLQPPSLIPISALTSHPCICLSICLFTSELFNLDITCFYCNSVHAALNMQNTERIQK
jgi:hypothetical protein